MASELMVTEADVLRERERAYDLLREVEQSFLAWDEKIVKTAIKDLSEQVGIANTKQRQFDSNKFAHAQLTMRFSEEAQVSPPFAGSAEADEASAGCHLADFHGDLDAQSALRAEVIGALRESSNTTSSLVRALRNTYTAQEVENACEWLVSEGDDSGRFRVLASDRGSERVYAIDPNDAEDTSDIRQLERPLSTPAATPATEPEQAIAPDLADPTPDGSLSAQDDASGHPFGNGDDAEDRERVWRYCHNTGGSIMLTRMSVALHIDDTRLERICKGLIALGLMRLTEEDDPFFSEVTTEDCDLPEGMED